MSRDVPRTVRRTEETDKHPCAVCNHTEQEFKDLKADLALAHVDREAMREQIVTLTRLVNINPETCKTSTPAVAIMLQDENNRLRDALTASAQQLEDMRVNYCAALDELKASAQRVEELMDAANEREIFYAGVLNDAEEVRCSQRDSLVKATVAVEAMRGCLELLWGNCRQESVPTEIELKVQALIAQHPAGEQDE